MGSEGDESRKLEGSNLPDPVQELIHTGLSRDVLLVLRDEGTIETSTLLSRVAAERFDGTASNDDRFRLVIEFEADVLPKLEEYDLVHTDDDEISLGFLSAPEHAELNSAASSRSRTGTR